MKRLINCLAVLFVFAIFFSCQKEVSVEQGAPATGSLQSTLGDCLPKTLAGTYMVARTLIDSNFMEVTINVATPGAYVIATDTVNGYSFKATGVFNATGATKVKLTGSGKPVVAGVDNFTVVFDTSFCFIDVTVFPAGAPAGPATYTLQTTGANCATSFSPSGTYVKDTVLNTGNTVTVQVNVTAAGTYSITTPTVNGYSFSGSGVFSTTGTQTIVLQGTGKPVAAGTNNFSVTVGSATCSFPVTVTATAASPCGITAQGTYTAGTALAAGNKVVLTHNYATAGAVTVTTNNVNGYSFGPSNVAAVTGSNTITLTGTGTPTAAGTNTFTVTFGDGSSCTFTVVVNAAVTTVNTDYFPTTANSYWTYSYDVGAADTFKMANSGPTAVYSGNTYQRFVYSDASGQYAEEFYRKNAAEAYYRSDDTAGYGAAGISFSQPRLDVLFLKNTLAAGDSLISDFNAQIDTSSTSTPSTVAVTWRYKYKVISTTATVTVNGKTFNNVYQLRETYDIGYLGFFFDSGVSPLDYYYVKGVGRVKLDYGTDIDGIRYWVVN